MAEAAWSLGFLTGVAKVLADTADGLTGSQIGELLARLRMEDPGSDITKWRRLLEAFIRRQNSDGHPQRIITFIIHGINPANYVQSYSHCAKTASTRLRPNVGVNDDQLGSQVVMLGDRSALRGQDHEEALRPRG